MKTVKEMANETRLVEIHITRLMPMSHMNADDTGYLKTALYGGVERARVSSQCKKHAWRKSDIFKDYEENLSPEDKTYRTRSLALLVLDNLSKKYEISDDDEKLIRDIVTEISGKEEGVVSFISVFDTTFLTKIVEERYLWCKENPGYKSEGDKAKKLAAKESGKDKVKEGGYFDGFNFKKEMTEFKKENDFKIPALIDFFGRMSTSKMIDDVDSALSVAHAFSTHAITQESDYFSAVDDINKEFAGSSGSAHMNETPFNSACYYEYYSFSLDQFCRNLEKNVDDEEYKNHAYENIIEALLLAATYICPSTKSTSFASASVPSAISVVVKDKNIPLSMGRAFRAPVEDNYGLDENSVNALVLGLDNMNRAYDMGITDEFFMAPDYSITPNAAIRCESVKELVEKVKNAVMR